ncbi:MAG: glycoside hydrolase family 15 [DPANN group archaeon]|nr:glycoside hydrolase family 15 [DPANN group archaeon]
MIKHLIRNRLRNELRRLQHKTGLLSASGDLSTGYDKAWVRDNVYESLGLEDAEDHDALRAVYGGLFDIFLKHESQIDRALRSERLHDDDYIHPRYCPVSLEQVPGPWANRQHDSVGVFLFKVGDLEDRGIHVIRGEDDRRILQKLVDYLGKIEYWHNPDSGMWEQELAVRSSSVGACLAGLGKISAYVNVDPGLLRHGKDALDKLLPYETSERKVDLSLLSLIFPYAIVDDQQRDLIIRNVENHLVRERGVVRYHGDWYYSNGSEAEWTFGFPWLAVIYRNMGKKDRYAHYLRRTIGLLHRGAVMPELYYAGTSRANENTSFGWSTALAICALS